MQVIIKWNKTAIKFLESEMQIKPTNIYQHQHRDPTLGTCS